MHGVFPPISEFTLKNANIWQNRNYLKLISTDILSSSTSSFVWLFGGVLVWFLCFLVFGFFWLKSRRENAFGFPLIIWNRSGEMHPVQVNIDCMTQCATQQPDSSCLCRRDILEKVLEQFLHWYFFTSEWVCR